MYAGLNYEKEDMSTFPLWMQSESRTQQQRIAWRTSATSGICIALRVATVSPHKSMIFGTKAQ